MRIVVMRCFDRGRVYDDAGGVWRWRSRATLVVNTDHAADHAVIREWRSVDATLMPQPTWHFGVVTALLPLLAASGYNAELQRIDAADGSSSLHMLSIWVDAAPPPPRRRSPMRRASDDKQNRRQGLDKRQKR